MDTRKLSFRLLLALTCAVFVLLAAACATPQPLTLTLDCNDEEFVQEVINLSETQDVQILKMYPGAEEIARSRNMLLCGGVAHVSIYNTDEHLVYRYAIDRDGNEFINYVGRVLVLPTPTLPPTPVLANAPSSIPGLPEGTWELGFWNIGPGIFAAPGGEFCYWERLSEFIDPEGIIANGLGDYRHVVEIYATDVGFSSEGCGWWSYVADVLMPQTTIPDGMWLVGDEIAPGTYSAPGGEWCQWERLSGFGGEFDDVIASDLGDTRHIVEILTTDAGFHTSGCGEWTPQN